MHKIHEKEFTIDDFSHEHLISFPYDCEAKCIPFSPTDALIFTINILNEYRDGYLKSKDKKYWWQMIQLLPSSYNQKRTIMFNYEVLANIYEYRREHKLDEWRDFCTWIKKLPYSEIITVTDETACDE